MWILRKNCSATRRKKLDHLPVLFENKKSDNHIIFLEATKGIKLPGRCFFSQKSQNCPKRCLHAAHSSCRQGFVPYGTLQYPKFWHVVLFVAVVMLSPNCRKPSWYVKGNVRSHHAKVIQVLYDFWQTYKLTIGDKIVETLSSHVVTLRTKQSTPLHSLPCKVGVLVISYR